MVTPRDRHDRIGKRAPIAGNRVSAKEEYAEELAAARGMRQVMGRVGRNWSIPASTERAEFAEEITRIKKQTDDQRNRQIPGDDIE